MTLTTSISVALAALLASAACSSSQPAGRESEPASDGMAIDPGNESVSRPGTAVSTGSANARQGSAPAAAESILAGSTPAAGSTMAGPVDELELRFDPPARLIEVTVTGPDGAMPMMVTAVGEVRSYSLPLPSLDAGNYAVSWRASTAGKDHLGSFHFSVR